MGKYWQPEEGLCMVSLVRGSGDLFRVTAESSPSRCSPKQQERFLSIQQFLGDRSPTGAGRRLSWSLVCAMGSGGQAVLWQRRQRQQGRQLPVLLAWRQGAGAGGADRHGTGEGEWEPWAHWVRADERIAAPVALFLRHVLFFPCHLIAGGSKMPRGSRRRWQQSRGSPVPWGTDCCPAVLLMEGLSPLPCRSLGCAVTWCRVPSAFARGAGLGAGAPGTLVAALQAYKGPHIPLQVMLVLEPERLAETLSREVCCALLSSEMPWGKAEQGAEQWGNRAAGFLLASSLHI